MLLIWSSRLRIKLYWWNPVLFNVIYRSKCDLWVAYKQSSLNQKTQVELIMKTPSLIAGLSGFRLESKALTFSGGHWEIGRANSKIFLFKHHRTLKCHPWYLRYPLLEAFDTSDNLLLSFSRLPFLSAPSNVHWPLQYISLVFLEAPWSYLPSPWSFLKAIS